MLLHDARRPARTAADGALVPLEEQDRTLWSQAQIAEGTAVLDRAMARAAAPLSARAEVERDPRRWHLQAMLRPLALQ